ncbi:MAG: hypothetical protein IPO92_02095 [Saprospiraceae bacterium]|nr:hypothetical protein [Saprospiraceae bacterium]
MNNFLIILAIIFSIGCIKSQHQDIGEKPKLWLSENNPKTDSSTMMSAFKAGKVQGHFRYFYSRTNNANNLTDYFANAFGGGLRFESAGYHGFRFCVSGFFIFNLASSNLAYIDPESGLANRYEIGLFDVSDPDNKAEINRIEELYLKYQYLNTTVTVGRQLINTSFINLQDGRMRPTAVEALLIESKIKNKYNLQIGWLYNIAPRGTRQWYGVAESFGIFPMGVQESGMKSDYKNNTRTKGIMLSDIMAQFSKNFSIQLSNIWVENVFNSALIQLDFNKKAFRNGKYILSFQVIKQNVVGSGGNEDPSKAFVLKDWSSMAYGAKVGWKNSRWDFSVNYNRITKEGRYLIPREWGRDPFFTFMPRERNEGYGDVHAYVLKTMLNIPKTKITLQTAFGMYRLPDVKDYRLNKYGMPSYNQLNIDVRYQFGGWLKGWETQVLWVNKWNQGNTYNNPKFIIHKVDMDLLNIVLNFKF